MKIMKIIEIHMESWISLKLKKYVYKHSNRLIMIGLPKNHFIFKNNIKVINIKYLLKNDEL